MKQRLALQDTAEATSAVLRPVLGSSVKDSYRITGERPVKGHNNDYRTEAPLI